MRKPVNIIGSLLAIAWATTSCQEEIESVVPNGTSSSLADKTVVVEFGAPCSTKGTFEVNNTDIRKMTAAFYKKSNGALAEKVPMTEGNRVVVSMANLTEDCNLYLLGNLSEYAAGDDVPWPSSESGVSSFGVNPINTDIPKANLEVYHYGTTYLKVNTDNDIALLKQVAIKNTKDKTSDKRTIKSVKVTGVPSKVYPFGSPSSGTGTGDEATASDITTANGDETITLYVPNLSSSSRIVTTVECKDGTGITKNETYTKTLTDEELDDKNKDVIKIPLEGVAIPEDNLTLDIVEDDTRTVNFGESTLNVYNDGTEYVTTVKATAGNGDSEWQCVLNWSGNPSASGAKMSIYEGKNTVAADKSLTSSGIVYLTAGKTYTLKISSTYTGSTQQTVKLYALSHVGSPNIKTYGESTVNIMVPEGDYITIPWASPIGTDSNCPMSNSQTMIQPKIREYSGSTYTLIDASWSPTRGVSFFIKPGYSYRLDSTTAYYYRTGEGDDAGLHQININGYYLVTANVSYDSLLKSSISIGYSNDHIVD